ncbi:MAG: type II secretion system F family protein [Eggerthellaceae bacterium]
MNIEILRGVALSLCAATIAGLLSFVGLRRLGGIESGPVKRPSRRHRGETRLDTLTYSVTRYVPMSEKVADATRDMLSIGRHHARRVVLGHPRGIVFRRRRRGLVAMPLVGGVQGLAAAGALAVAGLAAPQAWLLARRAEWRDELDRQLPDALDLMAICISAGSSFEGALASVGTRMDGAIAEAFARVAKEAAYSSRSEALLGLAERAQVNSITFFGVAVQAERAGSSLVDIIRMQAQSVRTERRLRVDDMTNKLSTKMLFPMLLLMLPSIIMLMLAPMILQLGEFF